MENHRNSQQPPLHSQGNNVPQYNNSNGSLPNNGRPVSNPHGQPHNGIPGTSPHPQQQQQQQQQYAPGMIRQQQQGMQHMIAGLPVVQQQQQQSQQQIHMQQQQPQLLMQQQQQQHPVAPRSSYGAANHGGGPTSSAYANNTQAPPMTQQRQQQQQAPPAWTVPNPLGLPKLAPPQQQISSMQQQQFHRAPPAPVHAPPPRPQQQQQQHQSGVTVVHQSAADGQPQKPKVVLSAEAKQALAKAIWSAIRSPTGTVDPAAMQAAVNTGLPEHAVRNAARVAREREAEKRHKQQQLQQQQSAAAAAAAAAQQAQQQIAQQQQQQQQLAQQQKQLQQQQKQIQQQKQLQQQQQKAHQQQQKDLQQKEQQQQMQAKVAERSKWKRAHNGIFVVQKQGRFQAVPFSVGAMVRSTNVKPVLQQPKQSLASEAARIQRELLQHYASAHKKESSSHDNDNTMKNSVALFAKPPPVLLEAERYRRTKIEPKKLARALDRAARKSRQAVADSLTKQYKELNKAVASHQTEFYKFHRQRRADSFRLAKNIRDSFDKEEKKKEKDAVAQERARLAALKANDMTAYSKLLEETRNDRLKFLLEKTEKHFAEISALLQERTGDGPHVIRMGGATAAAPAAATSYYASAHKHAEEVRQPSMLVGGDLKEYQLAGLQWMVSLYNNKLNGILADEMGLGKTIQAIALIAYLMEFKQNLGPFLVIVPLSTLSNWQNEFAKWCPAARTVCYKGTPVQRREIYKDQIRAGHFNVVLTTYEYIIRDKKYLRPIIWQYAIVDEGHRMKNAGSKFAVTLGKEYTTKFRVLLTGTPLMNDLSELWSLLNFLLPAIFNSVSTFDQWFSAPFAQFGGSSNTDDPEQDLLTNEERVLIIHRLHELLRPFMLRRVKSEVLDQLPEKVEKVLRCELSSWQKELYKQISKKAVAENGLLDTSGAANVPAPTRGLNNVVMQLRKVCNHPYLFSPEGYHINEALIRSSGKFALLDEMLPKLKAAGHRVLMFTQMTAVMTILEDYFAFRGFRSLRLDGSTPAEEREKRMYRYNAPDSPCFIFLLSTRAGGLGLNLVSGDTVILFDSDWNPAMDLQAQDRAHRIGQRSDVSVFRLVTYSPVEEKILSRATEKMNVSQLVVESGKFNKDSVDTDNSLERKRLMELLLTDFDTAQPKNVSEKSGSDDEDDDAGSESSDKEDLNELLSNNEADFQLYSAFDKQLEADGKSPAPLFVADADVPDWIRYPQQGGGQSVFAAADEGSRKRKDVAYDDGLTEKQFMRMMDKQSVQEENAKKKTKIKIKKGAARAAVPSASSFEEEEELDEGPSGSALLTDWTYRKLISCGKSVVALKDPSTKRRISEIFLDKPDPATFPDYYEIVEKPIAINDILRKCRAKIYATIGEFKDDWRLMFNNAAKFNGADSWVVQDAQALEKELERVLKKNGFIDDQKPPTCKEKKKPLRIKLSLKKK